MSKVANIRPLSFNERVVSRVIACYVETKIKKEQVIQASGLETK